MHDVSRSCALAVTRPEYSIVIVVIRVRALARCLHRGAPRRLSTATTVSIPSSSSPRHTTRPLQGYHLVLVSALPHLIIMLRLTDRASIQTSNQTCDGQQSYLEMPRVRGQWHHLQLLHRQPHEEPLGHPRLRPLQMHRLQLPRPTQVCPSSSCVLRQLIDLAQGRHHQSPSCLGRDWSRRRMVQ